MKSYATTIVMTLFLGFAAAAAAQEQSAADNIMVNMKEQLNLTPQQVNALKPIIMRKIARQNQPAQVTMSPGSILVRSQENPGLQASIAVDPNGELDKQEQEQISRILTQKQMGKWDSIQSQMIQERRKDIEEAMKAGEKPAL